jgi:hypothetical protein
VCSELELRRDDEQYLREDLGLDLNTSAVKRTVSQARHRGPGPPDRPVTFRPWLLVNEADLDVDVSFVSLRTDEDGRAVFRSLQRLKGVRQLIRVGDWIHAVVLHDGARDRRRIVTRLSDFVDDPHLLPVISETYEPAVATWRRLARLKAEQDRLLLK